MYDRYLFQVLKSDSAADVQSAVHSSAELSTTFKKQTERPAGEVARTLPMRLLGRRGLRAIHKGRPQNLAVFDPPICPHILAFYRQKLTVASAFGKPLLPLELVRTSFIMDESLNSYKTLI